MRGGGAAENNSYIHTQHARLYTSIKTHTHTRTFTEVPHSSGACLKEEQLGFNKHTTRAFTNFYIDRGPSQQWRVPGGGAAGGGGSAGGGAQKGGSMAGLASKVQQSKDKAGAGGGLGAEGCRFPELLEVCVRACV